MESTFITPDTLDKVSLSVPLLASYLRRGYRQHQIAEICNVSRQSVSEYIKRYYTDLAPLIDSDAYLAIQAKSLATKAIGRIDELLDREILTKRDLIPLNAISGTHIDKYRLLSGQSTENVSVSISDGEREELRAIAAESGRKAIAIECAKVEGDVAMLPKGSTESGGETINSADNGIQK